MTTYNDLAGLVGMLVGVWTMVGLAAVAALVTYMVRRK